MANGSAAAAKANDQARANQHGAWGVTAGSAPGFDLLPGDMTADLVIIGGGYCGLSAALHLAQKGAAPVLLEAAEPGFGASGRNGGQVIAGMKLDLAEMIGKFGPDRGQKLYRLGAGTVDLVFSLIERYQIRCEAHRNGWIQAAGSKKSLRGMERRARDLEAEGEPAELLDPECMSALAGTREYLGGLLIRRSGMVQPYSYARGLAAAAVSEGARIYSNATVERLAKDGAYWRLETSRGVVRAKQVLLATNAYMATLYPALRTAMVPITTYQIATDPLPESIGRTVLPGGLPVSDLMKLGVYFRRDDAGRFFIGGQGNPNDTVRPQSYDVLKHIACQIFPQLAGTEFPQRWYGKLALTFDHLPRLVTMEPGLHAAYGCNGRGVGLQTMIGKLAADRMLGDSLADLPIATMPPSRYPFYALRVPAMAIIRRVPALRRLFMRG